MRKLVTRGNRANGANSSPRAQNIAWTDSGRTLFPVRPEEPYIKRKATGESSMLKASVSGSFHRHMFGIYSAVNELRAFGIDVLSPSDPRVVDALGEFLFVASDRLRSIKLVQDRHFEA